MRVAIYHNLPSGGGKRALHEITRRLAARHEVTIYSLSCAEHDYCDLRPHSREHIEFSFTPLRLRRRPFGRLNQGIRTLDLLRLLPVQRRLAQAINTSVYDVVFVHHCQFGQAPAVLRFLTVPTVYYCQEPPRLVHEPAVPRPYTAFSRWQQAGNLFDPLPGIYRSVLKQLDRASAQAASLVLVNSAYSKESVYRTYGIFGRVSYLGVDTELFHQRPAGERDFTLTVGALNPNKGFDFLIRSLALLNEGQRPPLIIVSNYADPREKAYLSDLAQRLEVDVTFRTGITDSELVDLYGAARLTLYAPIMEPFGFVPIESMACGTPVVGVREGGVRESIVDGKTGILVERDAKKFAAAVERLLANSQLRDQYGTCGREHVRERWSWERSVRTLEGYLASVAQERDPIPVPSEKVSCNV